MTAFEHAPSECKIAARRAIDLRMRAVRRELAPRRSPLIAAGRSLRSFRRSPRPVAAALRFVAAAGRARIRRRAARRIG